MQKDTQKKVVEILSRYIELTDENRIIVGYSEDTNNLQNEAQKMVNKLSPKTIDGITCPSEISVIGRRWFQKSYGNTYHTVRVYIDGELSYTSHKQYGYGDQYADTAFQWLLDSGIIPKPKDNTSHFRYIRDELGIDYSYNAEDVSREKDL